MRRLTVTVPEAAELLGISTKLAWELVLAGKLRSVRAGRRVLVPVEALAEFLGTRPDAIGGEGGDDDDE